MTTSIINIYVVCLFFVLLYSLDRPLWLNEVLYKLGEGSTNMWFVHAFVCIYFFHDLTYSLKNPLLVYLFVVVSSYLAHLIINVVYVKCKSYLEIKWQI